MMHDSKNGKNGSEKGSYDDENEDNSSREDNVISFAALRKREKQRGESLSGKPKYPPLINLPPVTQSLILINVIILGAMMLASNELKAWIYMNFGYIPSHFTGEMPFTSPFQYLSPITHMFLHGGLFHIFMNAAMLAAFGTLVEKTYGSTRYLSFYFACGLLGALGHTIVMPYSVSPVIGASGAISGLFAANIVILQRLGQLGQGKYGLWPIIAIWCGISFLFAWAGGANIGDIAWAAHLGGFLGAFVLLRIPYFRI